MEQSRYVHFANGFEPTVHILSANHEFSVVPEAMIQPKARPVSLTA